jgi:serine/threonine protein kinase/tetratricopeptide (TPR) repeat protein
MSSNWGSVQDILMAAVEVDVSVRRAFVEEACQGDSTLMSEVLSLLEWHETEGIVLDVPLLPIEQPTHSREGNQVGHYQIIEKLDSGGMGVVFKARDTKLDRLVALKFLLPHLTDSAGARARFIREAKAASSLDDPNICTIHEIGENPSGEVYIAMTYYEGQTLAELISSGSLDFAVSIDIASQIAQGLSRAHDAGIIHRDIKPANILVTSRGRVKILDFGIAQVAGSTTMGAGGTLGTMNYMSPEQIQGLDLDPRTDIWSLGVVLYEMLTGVRPFVGSYPTAVIHSILNDSPQRVSEVNQRLSEGIELVVSKALERDRNRRYGQAAELADDLERVSGGTTDLINPGRSSFTHPRKRGVLFAISFVALTVAGGLALWLTGSLSSDGSKTASADPNMIAVMPFTVRGDPELEYLEHGLVELFSTSLDGAGDLRTVDPNALLGKIAKEGLTIVSPADAMTLAVRLGAGRAVIGTASRFGDRIQITVSLYDHAGVVEIQQSADATAEDQIPASVEAITQKMLNQMLGARAGDFVETAATSTKSFTALKAYLSGAATMRRNAWFEAVDHFTEAVEADSAFALAWIGLNRALSRVGPRDSAFAAGEAAWRLRGSLPDRQRRAFEGHYYGFVSGYPEKALAMYRAVLADYPNDVEALLGIGLVLYHYNAYSGRSVSEADPYIEKAWGLLPVTSLRVWLRYLIALEEGNYAKMDSLEPLVISFSGWPNTQAYIDELKNIRDRSLDDGTWSYGGLGVLNAFATEHIVLKSISAIEDMDAARQVVDVIVESGEFVGEDLEQFVLLGAQAAGAQGQFRARADLLASMNTSAGLQIIDRALTYGLPIYPVSDSLLRAADEELVRWDTTAIRITYVDGQDMHPGEYAAVKTYLRALLAMRLGDYTRLSEFKAALAAAADSTTGRDFAYSSLSTISAIERWESGDYQSGLAAIDDARFTILWSAKWRSPLHAQALDRFVMAELFAGAGRFDEALEAYGSLAGLDIHQGGLMYLGPAYIRQAEIYEQLGDKEEAIEYYTRLLRVWENCDPELVTIREGARHELERLKSEVVKETATLFDQ